MNKQTIPSFHVIGIAVRTTNEHGQSGTDIPALWEKFISGGMLAKIPEKMNDTLYCIYTDYEKDHTRPYTTILGCRVENLDNIPEGMVGRTIEEAGYKKFTAKGDLMNGAVFSEWQKIWNTDMPRAFKTDFEVYGSAAWLPEGAEADIFVGLK